jgi:hypothetical protein
MMNSGAGGREPQERANLADMPSGFDRNLSTTPRGDLFLDRKKCIRGCSPIRITRANTVTPKQYINRKNVRRRYGDISEMTLWRWEHDKKLGFPNAIDINGRKYYDLADVEAWERKRAARTAA